MKIINEIQGSKSWLDWRRTKIMASECATILGKNPYETAFQLYQRKLGLLPDVEETPAMRRGKDLEPVARKRFQEIYKIAMSPIVAESEDNPWMAASLDGFSVSDNSILEIKCNGEKNHNIAKNGEVPETHWLQMQHQMYVTYADKGYYYSFDGKEGVMVEVKPDHDAFDIIIPQLYAFWKGLILFEPPELTEKDYKDMSGLKQWRELADRYSYLDGQIKTSEEEKDRVRKQLIELAGDTNCKGAGVKLMKTLQKGRVMYDAIEILKEVDLDKYRKDPTSSWRIYVE